MHLAQLFEALFVRKKYDAVISWSEQFSIPFSFLLRLTRSRVTHVAVCYRISSPKKARLLRTALPHLDGLLLMSTAQHKFAVDQLKIPPTKAYLLRWFVDHRFWRPMPVKADMISTSGREMRDYGTLIRAMRGLDIPCHIGAKYIRGKKDAWVKVVERENSFPPNVSVGVNEKIAEIRSMVARSRFVVVPLLPCDDEVGSTVILEAMAMEKAVICSRIAGQEDIIKEGETGLFVTPQNPDELREAIQYLWDHNDIAEQMGKAGRKRVKEFYTWEGWVNDVRRIVEGVIGEKNAVEESVADMTFI
jgi:glycosyltransferase involved in cell wall biosynthesis